MSIKDTINKMFKGVFNAPENKSFTTLFVFMAVFFVVLPLFLSQSLSKPMQPIDWSPMSVPGGDYVATYAASNSLRSGFSMYKNNAEKGNEYRDRFASGEYSRYSYPPLQAFLFVPLSFLSFKDSYFVWNIISILLIISSIALVSQLMKKRLIAFVFLLLLYGLSSFSWFHIERGQTDTLTLFFISLFLYLYNTKKSETLAAFFLALACLLKVFPLIFAGFFLIRKEYKLLVKAFLFGVVIVLLTGFQTWMYWIQSILPMYSSYYLGSEVDHSFAYLLSGFLDFKFPVIVGLSRIIVSVVAGVFFLFVFLSKRRNEWLLMELAILSIIMEIFPPWAANYKLVIMIFLFLVPLHFIERGFFGKKFIVVIPILGSFVFFLPLYNESYGRLPFSFLGSILSMDFVPYFSLQKIGEYRASIAIVFCLIYLLSVYGYLQFRDSALFENIAVHLRGRKRWLANVCGAIIVFAGVVGAMYCVEQYRAAKTGYENTIREFGREEFISEGLSVVGYDIEKKNNGGYDVEIIFKVDKALDKNLTIYLHGHWMDGSQSVEGANFFPHILTNFWPTGKMVVVKKSIFLTPVTQDIKMGFFDMSDGSRFGKEIDLGVSDLR